MEDCDGLFLILIPVYIVLCAPGKPQAQRRPGFNASSICAVFYEFIIWAQTLLGQSAILNVPNSL